VVNIYSLLQRRIFHQGELHLVSIHATTNEYLGTCLEMVPFTEVSVFESQSSVRYYHDLVWRTLMLSASALDDIKGSIRGYAIDLHLNSPLTDWISSL
jgi:hypothetical protein